MGPFFLGWVDSRERALSWTRKPPRHVVLRLERVPFIDATGLKRLESTLDNLRKRGIAVLPTGAHLRVLRKLVRAELPGRPAPGSHSKDLAAAPHLPRYRHTPPFPTARLSPTALPTHRP